MKELSDTAVKTVNLMKGYLLIDKYVLLVYGPYSGTQEVKHLFV
jgi:hypothetical protein